MRMNNLSMKLAALLLGLLGGTASMHAGWKTVGKKSVDGFVYVLTYNDESGLRVANIGEVDKDNIPTGHVTLRSSVSDDEGNSYTCKTIGDGYGWMFDSSNGTPCPNLTGLTIPSSYTSVGISGATGLTVLNLSEGVETLGVGGCEGLTSITVPQTVKTCNIRSTGITSITLPEGVTSFRLGGNKKLTSVTLPSATTVIPENAFSGCESLESITLPEGVTKIDEQAFSGSGLKRIVLPPHIKSLGGAFNGAVNLEEVVMNDELEVINATFDYCEGLKKVVFGSGLKVIGDYAFRNTGLEEIDIPDHVTTLGTCAFCLNPNLRRVHIGKGVTDLKGEPVSDFNPDAHGSIFNGCTKLTEVTTGSDITEIGISTFSTCYKLTYVPGGNKIKRIGDHAFWTCAIREVDLPATVEYVGNECFSKSGWVRFDEGTYYLSTSCAATTPPALGEGAFHPDLLDRPLYVPLGCKAAYQAAEGWKRFTDIREKSFAGVQDVQRSDADNALYYSLEGRQGKTHGVNIRRTADGKTRKVVVK